MASYFSNLSDKLSTFLSTDQEAKVVSPPTCEEDVQCRKDWGLTLAEEDALLEQLRDEVLLERPEAESVDLFVLRRFLRARKHNILKAKEMFLATLTWRASVGADTIRQDYNFTERPQFAEHYPEGFYGVDRAGRPIYVQQPGNIDPVKLWEFTTLERAVRYHVQQQERYCEEVVPAATAASGRLQEQSLVIIDMEGVGVSTLTGEVRKIMGQIMAIDQDYYPELMWKAVVVNAPTSFRVIWSMVKYLLDDRTQGKIEVLPVDFAPALQRYVAPENLMPRYGGTNPAPLTASPGPWRDEKVLEEVASGRWKAAAKRRHPLAPAKPAQ